MSFQTPQARAARNSVEADAAVASAHDAEAAPTVAVVCGATESETLTRALQALSCDVEVMTGWPYRGDDDGFTAVLISDTIDDPLEPCRHIASRRPVGLLTGDGGFAFRLAAARAGVDVLLPRPLDTNELGAWLKQHAQRRCRRPFSILVVDDDEMAADLYAAALRLGGMETRVATTASAALEHIDAATPDLVLLDIQMPDVTGIEIARMIRQNRRFLSVPIVFLSAERDALRQLEARRFGGDEFVQKPIDLDHLVSIVRLRAERAEVMRAAMERDGLTGLLNHGRFKERLAHELDRCDRTGSEISVAMIDLDRFKQINDRYGHPMGDAVIRGLATSLSTGLRRIDIIGRYGGEEFAVIMLDTPPAAAAAAVDRQRLRFREIDFVCAGKRFRVSFSAGLVGSRDCPNVESIIAAADRALYAAKRGGRDRVVIAAAIDTAPTG